MSGIRTSANTKVQVIETDGGERLAVLSLAEYERLAAVDAEYRANEAEEDEGTARIIAERLAAVVAGNQALIPAAIAEARMKGENGVRAARKMRGLTQEQLATKAGMGQAYLSQIETGERGGPLPTIRDLARVLEVPVEWLLPR